MAIAMLIQENVFVPMVMVALAAKHLKLKVHQKNQTKIVNKIVIATIVKKGSKEFLPKYLQPLN